MKLSTATKQMMHIAIVESDPLRSIGFPALLESESDFDLIAAALPEMLMQQNIDLVLLGEPRRSMDTNDLICLSIDAKLKRYGGVVHVVVPPNPTTTFNQPKCVKPA